MIRHYVLTLNGSAQRLSAALADTTPSGPSDIRVRSLLVQAFGTNANPVYVGGFESGAPTSSSYGQRIEAATAGVPPAPSLIFGEGASQGLSRMSEWYVIGTNNEKITITADHQV